MQTSKKMIEDRYKWQRNNTRSRAEANIEENIYHIPPWENYDFINDLPIQSRRNLSPISIHQVHPLTPENGTRGSLYSEQFERPQRRRQQLQKQLSELSQNIKQKWQKNKIPSLKSELPQKLITKSVQKTNPKSVLKSATKSEPNHNKINEANSSNSKRNRNSILVLLGGCFMFFAYDPMLEMFLSYNLQLRPGGLLTSAWLYNPIPLYVCWYLFSIENTKQFLNGSLPRVHEVGPFCFDGYRNRTVLEWQDDVVIFEEKFKFIFNPGKSKSLDTEIEIVNVPILAVVMSAKNMLQEFYLSFIGPMVYNAITTVFRYTGEDLATRITVRQLLLGWELNIIRYMDAILSPFRSLGLPLPDFQKGFLGIIESSFGIMTSVSYFTIGPFYAYRSAKPPEHTAGQLFRFSDLTKYPYYDAPCNRLGGSDGIFFPRPLKEKHVYFYMHHLCRLVRFDRNVTEYFMGTKVRRYGLDERMFDQSLRRNRCFCIKKRPIRECDGWSDVSPCAFGVAVGISMPHFYNSPRRQREVIGLKPNASLHLGYIQFLEKFGAPTFANIKLQGVLKIDPIPSVSAIARMPKIPLPLGWIQLSIGADTPILASLLFVGSYGGQYGSYGFLLGGFGLSGLMFGSKILSRLVTKAR